MSIGELLGRRFVYRFWDWKDRSQRLRELGALESSQWWGTQELRALQMDRLSSLVRFAKKNVPFYRESLGGIQDITNWSQFTSLPLIRKADVRTFGEQMVSRSASAVELLSAKTGGSTGTALNLKFDRQCQERRNAAAMRSDSWAGWRPGMLVAALWGSPDLPSTFRQRLRNHLHDRMFYLDTMNLTETTMAEFARQLVSRRPGGLFGHAHSLFVFARFVEQSAISVPPFRAIIATSMMLLENERLVIERVFRCPVTNRYGCEEVGLIASECERHHGMHVNAEHVIVEVLRKDGTPAAIGEEGEIVVTDLVNKGMPLIRYAIEDVASWASGVCDCGRQLPRLERLVGRVADFLVRQDGGFVAGVSLVEKTLTAIPGIEQLQIVQESIHHIRLHVVAALGYGAHSEAELRRVFAGVFGPEVSVDVVKLDRIPQEKNGKFRFAICRIGSVRA